MIQQSTSGLVYYQFEIFKGFPLVHGIFSRKGGISPVPWNSLNLSVSSGDTYTNVLENRKRVFNALNLDNNSVCDVWLVHGTKVHDATRPRAIGSPHKKADVIATSKKGLSLLMLFADCVPIFLFDPVNNAIAIAHAGWKGSLNKVADIAIKALGVKYCSKPCEILAGIGPSIGPDHYEVGTDVLKLAANQFGSCADRYFKTVNGKNYMDLWSMNEDTLRESGVTRIEQSNICTACDTDEWFSYRAEKGDTGRFPAVFCLA